MSHWNFRIVFDDDHKIFSLSEVFYDDDNRPWGWAPAVMEGYTTVEELDAELKKIQDAFEKRILRSTEIKANGKIMQEKWDKEIEEGKHVRIEDV